MRLMSSQQAACTGEGPSPPCSPSQRRRKRTRCPRGTGVRSQVVQPRRRQGIGEKGAAGCILRVEHQVETRHTSFAVEHHREGLGCQGPPLPKQRRRGCRLEVLSDVQHLGAVCRGGGFEGEELRTRREERLAAYGVLDEVQGVGCVAPQVGLPSLRGLVPQLSPSGTAVVSVALRIGRLQGGRDRLLHGLVHDQSVAAGLDERQCAQLLDGVLWRDARQHRTQQ